MERTSAAYVRSIWISFQRSRYSARRADYPRCSFKLAPIILNANFYRKATAVPSSKFTVQYPDAPLGAEISGIDLSQDIDESTFREIEEIFHERSVIWFR